jgi:hypothetical protein
LENFETTKIIIIKINTRFSPCVAKRPTNAACSVLKAGVEAFEAAKRSGYAQKDAIKDPTGYKNKQQDGRGLKIKLENCLLNNKKIQLKTKTSCM